MVDQLTGAAWPREVVGVLRPVTGAGGTTQAQLDKALADIVRALRGGQASETLLPSARRPMVSAFRATRAQGHVISPAILLPDAIRRMPSAAQPAAPAPEAGSVQPSSTLASIRSLPVDVPIGPLAPEWARGQAPTRSHGPFVNELGEQIWIDIFEPVHRIGLYSQPSPLMPARLMALLPLQGAGLPPDRILRLAAGSVWLPTALLAGARPGDEFIGLKIKGGTLRLSGPATSVAQSIVVSGAWEAQLHLTLDPPRAADPDAKVGGDVQAAQIDLPASLELDFGVTGMKSIGLGDGMLRAYAATAQLTRSQEKPLYDPATQSLIIPCSASVEAFDFGVPKSEIFQCGPQAPIVGSGWSVPVTVTQPDKLGEAIGAGALWLALGAGLSAKWSAHPAPVRLSTAKLLLAPGSIVIVAETAVDPLVEDFDLWNEPSTGRRSRVEFAAPAGATLTYFSSAFSEAMLAVGQAVGHLDRPLSADGGRIAVGMPLAILVQVKTATSSTVFLFGIDVGSLQAPFLAFALENLLLKVRPPTLLVLEGRLEEDGIASGRVGLLFQSYAALPTLPDPYAANFDTTLFGGNEPIGWLGAIVGWTAPDKPLLNFAVETFGAAPATNQVGRLADIEISLYMLDLSSNADQFGVMIPLESLATTSLQGLSLRAPAGKVGIFTLPPISWEPMLTKQPTFVSGDPPLVPAPNDGGVALLQADSVTLVPVEPTPLLLEYISAVEKERAFEARLPLPFGIIANLDTEILGNANGQSTFIADGGSFGLHQPSFAGALLGSRQLRIEAPPSKIPGRERTFPQPSYTTTEDTNDYAAGVLSANIRTRWIGDFGFGKKGVPLERYELTGYGASLFSDWRDRFALGPAITEARFDVIVGRTSYEVVQMESRLYPWCVKVVRIITIKRTNGGWVLREDSGWIAASDGVFLFPKSADVQGVVYSPPIDPAFGDAQIHRGAVGGVINVRNIRLSAPQFPLPSDGTIFQPVKFDADLLVDPGVTVLAGGVASAGGTHVPGREIDGFIQITGTTYAGTIDGQPDPFAMPASRAQLFELLQIKGPAVAPITCTVAVGGVAGNPSLTQRCSQATVACNDDPVDPQLVGALRGTPLLPRDGAWSLGRMKSTDTAPNALDPQFAAPLVRPVAPAAGSDKWHIADPADIKRLGDGDTPNVLYGLLQSVGTQKLFMARPQAIGGVSQIAVPQAPSFADVASLFNAAGIFPNLGDAFDFDTLNGVNVNGGDFGFDKQFTIKPVSGQPRETLLMDLDIVKIVIRYCDEAKHETVVAMKVAPAQSPRWSISLKRVAFVVKYKSDDLIKMFADVKADEKSSPTFDNLNVNYVGLLEILQDIFSNVQQVARFLPGGADAGLKVGFSQGRLTVRNEFALPTLPLGTGELTDIAVAMGVALELSPLGIEFIAGLGSSEKPFRWVVSPLAGTGCVQVGVNNKGLNILVQGGIGVGLCIDLGIAAGSASITLAVELNTSVDPFLLKAILSGRASVDVLQGLASATITLAAGLGIIPPSPLPALPPPFPTKLGPYTIGFVASVSVGIHISVCWVVDIDWDDYWQFRQDITTPSVSLPF